ncbi:oxygenase 2OG-Fe(II) [Gluconobacter thailandicus F149-1 = NBRC 100600]|nr:2-oxoglutarate and iron-dependent oxygenase domain-containing protein [Gluconobacter thailandicus]KXV33926.1 2OG-Fe(II) oxygenase [Gluconobacter thailandicus]KXV53683.1 2OG-Fe(II) oxygenase [Gluconobacter thailandicus]GAN94187.1 oxygenase 2OG-Fe(II) [Gluconobacter thailandicus F149-1 = NBRC 100600]GBR57212.1 isopenicillin N synthase [Gluconobacter thailandicus F149-1 = NBRC 100600]GEL87880.1 2OG-Fe(II) oxygenase [Gluconobacter thailandicus F149-1 = NBRC 100600]
MSTLATTTMSEIETERRIGGAGTSIVRDIPRIDLSSFEDRKQEIADALWSAATEIGFFQVYNHGIPQDDIDRAFSLAEHFFKLPTDKKAALPLKPGTNAGWEFREQVRPSTGTPDHKESFQITLPRMAGLWPQDTDIAGFQEFLTQFEHQNWLLGMKILSCFAMKLGFEEDFFTSRHEPSLPDYQCTLRLIHYMSMENAKPADFENWRAGAHSDFDCLTLLHQRAGEGGLQVCPGKDVDSGAWTDVEPATGYVTCNIGDMLMRWSDDRLLSTLHRVRMPKPGEYLGERLSIPFFCQANRDAIIQGPDRKYAPISAQNYLLERLQANFAALQKARSQ